MATKTQRDPERLSRRKPAPSSPAPRSTNRLIAFYGLGIAAVTFVAYIPSFRGAFVMDDFVGIVDNTAIRYVFPLGHFLDSSQPLLDFSLALNYSAGNVNPWGYHLVNVAIHLLASLTLFGVLRRTMKLIDDPRIARTGDGLGFAVAAIWAVHPLQTESVTYLIQRSEALMGLFYLLTLYSAIRGMTSVRGTAWYFVCILACAAGMAGKAVMVTAPVVVLLYDRCFIAGSFTEAVRRRWGLYLGLVSTWFVLVALGVVGGVLDTPKPEAPSVGFGYKGVTPLEYLGTQPGVLLHYLVLSFWPLRLCLDEGWPVARGMWGIVVPAFVIIAIIAASSWALVRRKKIGFLGAAFLLILLPTSSFIPIRDLSFEHRMYLPLAAVLTAAAIAVSAICNRLSANRAAGVLALLTIIAFSILTWTRNKLYADPVELWRDTVAKAPHHPRPHNALGYALLLRGNFAGAMEQFEDVLRIDPQNAGAYANMGEAYLRQRRYADAANAFASGLKISPTGLGARIYFYYGVALLESNQLDDAIEAFKQTISRDPSRADAYYNLGNALRLSGRRESAAGVYQQALQVNPRYIEAMVNLGLTLDELGRSQEAVSVYRSAVAIMPPGKHDVLIKTVYNMGLALQKLGRLEDARKAFQAVLTLNPQHAGAKAAREALQKAAP